MKGILKYAKHISDDVTLLAGGVVDIIGSSETEYLCKSIDGYEFPVSKFEIYIIENTPIIDWEQRRYEIARDCVANTALLNITTNNREKISQAEFTVETALIYADELIKQLKGEQQ